MEQIGEKERMNTQIVKMDRRNLKVENFLEAAELIRKGKLVAFPTETVYGLGGDALNEEAAKKIYEAKGRPSDNPLIVHISSMRDLERAVGTIPLRAALLAERFWPGPLTMILQKSSLIPYATTGGLKTVAVRMPSDEIARMLIKESRCLIAAPSANASGKPSTTKAEHVYADLNGKIDMIIDGGSSVIGLESTIIDLTSKETVILRPGYITKEQIEQVIGDVRYDEAILNETISDQKPKAPGMKYKHYAPKADMIIYEGSESMVIKAINEEAARKEAIGAVVGIMATDETIHQYKHGIVKSIGTRKNEASIASQLFSLLREFDDLGVSYIYTESFKDMVLGCAVMNRLLKASGYKKVTV